MQGVKPRAHHRYASTTLLSHISTRTPRDYPRLANFLIAAFNEAAASS